MSELASQRDYWNSRAPVWGNYDVPLIPSQPELDFHRGHVVPGGHTLVLGATRELCAMARDVSGKVTAVDFAEDVIEALRLDGVQYTCSDWFEFLERGAEQFDNIMTDGGLLCLEFPESWQRVAELIEARLKPHGVFSARVYLSTAEKPKANYKNANLGRFVSRIADARAENNWTLQMQHGDYKDYDVRYAFPPDQEVQRVFGRFALRETLVPEYEEGSRFVSYAWQRS